MGFETCGVFREWWCHYLNLQVSFDFGRWLGWLRNRGYGWRVSVLRVVCVCV